MDMQQEEEKGRLFGATIKALLVVGIVFFIFGKPFEFIKNKTNKITDIINSEMELIEDTEITEEEYIDTIEDNEEEVFSVVEQMPIFKGCSDFSGDEASQCTMQKIQQYTSQVEYPQIAIDNDIEGKVYIRFEINKRGFVSNVKILRGVDEILDNSALNHIKNMPRFAKPGYQNGQAVRVQYNIPIVFKLG